MKRVQDVLESGDDVFFSESECLDDACELCGYCCTTAASAAVAYSADHDEVSEFSFADVVCWIDLRIGGESEEIFKISMGEIVDEPTNGCVFVVSVGELEYFCFQLTYLFRVCLVVESFGKRKYALEMFMHVFAFTAKGVSEFFAILEYVKPA